MKTFIFANGEFTQPYRPINIKDGDLVIAADGGSRHLLTLNIRPQVLIGDLDSTDPFLVDTWQADGVEIIKHPEEKDQTDLELAITLAQNRNAQKIEVYGAIGGRLDMTFGNLFLLAFPGLTTPTTFIHGPEEVHLIRSGNLLTIVGEPDDLVSLISIQPGDSTVSTTGLLYPLKNEKLEYGQTRGMSNRLTGKRGTIHLDQGHLAVIHTRNTSVLEE